VSRDNLAAVIKDLIKDLPKERLKELYQQAERIARWKIAAFRPHKKQDKFFRSKAKVRLFQGGNRSGKTTAGCLEAIAHCIGMRPWYPADDPAREVKVKIPSRGRIVCEDFSATAKKHHCPKTS